MNDFNKQLKANHKKYKDKKYTLEWYRNEPVIKGLLEKELSKYHIKKVYKDKTTYKHTCLIEIVPIIGLPKKLCIKRYCLIDEYSYWRYIQESWLLNKKYRLDTSIYISEVSD